jgi:RNA recognition motif-containing protein
MNIYVGNLTLETTEDNIRQAFEAFGQVLTVNIIRDKLTSQSRGFAFVGMPSETEAKAAISQLNGTELNGQTISAEEGRAKPRPPGLYSPRGGSRGRGRPGEGRPGGFRGGRGGGSGRGGPRGGGRGGPRGGGSGGFRSDRGDRDSRPRY